MRTERLDGDDELLKANLIAVARSLACEQSGLRAVGDGKCQTGISRTFEIGQWTMLSFVVLV
jgi:hypothetical protein